MQPRYWLLISLLVVGVIALGSGSELLHRVALLIVALLVLSYLWARLRVQGVQVNVERGTSHVQAGSPFSQRIIVEHQGKFSRTRMEFREPSDLTGHQANAILNLPERGTHSWKATTLCRRRGHFTLGPGIIASSDPFGLFHAQRRVTEPFSLWVYPRQVELPRFSLSSGLPEHGHRQQRGHQASTSAVTARDYLPGDGFNRIHWPSTARLGRLMVKEFELETSSELWLALDMDRKVHRGEDEESTEEYAVTLAASLARRFLQEEYSVGLLVNGQPPFLLPGGRGSRQLGRILEVLAEVRATGEGSLPRALMEHGQRLSQHSTLVVVTPSWEGEWVEALAQLTGRGMRAVAVLLEASSFGPAPSPQSLAVALAARAIPVYRVRRGDNLAVALSQQVAPGPRERTRGELVRP